MNGSEERIPDEAIFDEDPTSDHKTGDEQKELLPIVEENGATYRNSENNDSKVAKILSRKDRFRSVKLSTMIVKTSSL